jgi:hypothetical protein
MRRFKDRIASFEPTAFDRMTSDISRLAAISSLQAISTLYYRMHRTGGGVQRARRGLVDLLVELRGGRKPPRHHFGRAVAVAGAVALSCGRGEV